MQTLPMAVRTPHTVLLRYTATDTEDNEAAFMQAVSHNKLEYKVMQQISSCRLDLLMTCLFP